MPVRSSAVLDTLLKPTAHETRITSTVNAGKNDHEVIVDTIPEHVGESSQEGPPVCPVTLRVHERIG